MARTQFCVRLLGSVTRNVPDGYMHHELTIKSNHSHPFTSPVSNNAYQSSKSVTSETKAAPTEMISNVCCPIALTFVSAVSEISFLNLPECAPRTIRRGESVRINCSNSSDSRKQSAADL